MGSWYDYYDKNHKALDEGFITEKQEGASSNVGALVGISQPSSAVSNFVTHMFSDYILAPLASTIEYAFQTPIEAHHPGPSMVSSTHGPAMSGKRPPAGMIRRSAKNKTGFNGGAAHDEGVAELVRIAKRTGKDVFQIRGAKYSDAMRRDAKLRLRSESRNSNGTRYGGYRNINARDDYFRNRRYRMTDVYPLRSQPKMRTGGSYRNTGKPRTAPRGLNTLSGPPSTVSGAMIGGTLTSGNDYRVIKQSKEGSIMSGKLYLGIAQYFKAAGVQATVLWLPTDVADCGGQYYFQPANAAYVPEDSAIYKAAQNFEQYRIENGTMTFVACTSAYSNPDLRAAALVIRDYDFFERLGSTNFVNAPGTPAADSTPTRRTLLSNPNACATPAWVANFTCPIPKTGWLWTSSPDTTSTIVNFADSAAASRQTYGFVMGLNIEGTAPPDNTSFNVFEVYLDINIIFRRQAPTGQRDVNLQLSRRAEMSLSRDEIKHFRSLCRGGIDEKKAKAFFDSVDDKKKNSTSSDKKVVSLSSAFSAMSVKVKSASEKGPARVAVPRQKSSTPEPGYVRDFSEFDDEHSKR